MPSQTDSEKIYNKLIRKIKRIKNIGNAEGLLRWDQQVMMPNAGTPARSQQLSALSSIQHELLTDEKIGKMLDEIDEEEISKEKRSAIREVKREFERAKRLPTELIEKISKASSEAFSKWLKSKEENDFSIFAPNLEKLIELKTKYAEYIDPDVAPYQVLFEDYEPYLGLEIASDTLSKLRKELVPFIEKIKESEVKPDRSTFENNFSGEKQREFAQHVLDILGFKWEYGRLDTAPHPFTSGTQYDVRVTTRFEDNLLDGLFSTIHEFGHANYTLGLPKEKYGTPLGESRGFTFHESQSRLWENHIGRSRPFWEYILPELKNKFPSIDASIEDVYKTVNKVHEDNLIRVDADELTYHMHIILRFEIENDLIENNIEVKEIPSVWNDKMENYLGVRPENDSEGCLQDVHWSHGSFGYFPTYSLGSVLSAQIYDSAKNDIDRLEEKMRNGKFESLKKWLTEKIHRYGKRYTTNELIQKSTGEEFNPSHFIDYIKNKYSEIYEI